MQNISIHYAAFPHPYVPVARYSPTSFAEHYRYRGDRLGSQRPVSHRRYSALYTSQEARSILSALGMVAIQQSLACKQAVRYATALWHVYLGMFQTHGSGEAYGGTTASGFPQSAPDAGTQPARGSAGPRPHPDPARRTGKRPQRIHWAY